VENLLNMKVPTKLLKREQDGRKRIKERAN
jgi:hypothetical protein